MAVDMLYRSLYMFFIAISLRYTCGMLLSMEYILGSVTLNSACRDSLMLCDADHLAF